MKREIMQQLNEWRDSRSRKPLMLRGARQVGKTWVLKEFGSTYKDGYLHIDFDKDPEFGDFFESSLEPKRILNNISIATRKPITTDTLIIFDEIQACPKAINALKYFNEDAPEYHVVSAGSLLGVQLAEGFPVGKVTFMDMYPMSFREFLMALGDDNYASYLADLQDFREIPEAFHNYLLERLRQYIIIGGMPEAVKTWSETTDIREVDHVLSDILSSFDRDFGKHAPTIDVRKIELIWDSLPSQLSKENKKFLYSVVKSGARAREYENALNWLVSADLVRRVPRIKKPGLPIKAYEDLGAFKIYMCDTGLLRRHARLSSSAYIDQNGLFTEFRGALTESYVQQEIAASIEPEVYYWSEARSEVDLIMQISNAIIPIEIKSGINVSARSLKKYMEEYEKATPLAIRISQKNLRLDSNVLNIPLYMVGEIKHLLQLADLT